MSKGSFLIFFNRPIAAGIMMGAICLLVLPLINVVRSRFKQDQ
jgi:TctA family transporter